MLYRIFDKKAKLKYGITNIKVNNIFYDRWKCMHSFAQAFRIIRIVKYTNQVKVLIAI